MHSKALDLLQVGSTLEISGRHDPKIGLVDKNIAR